MGGNGVCAWPHQNFPSHLKVINNSEGHYAEVAQGEKSLENYPWNEERHLLSWGWAHRSRMWHALIGNQSMKGFKKVIAWIGVQFGNNYTEPCIRRICNCMRWSRVQFILLMHGECNYLNMRSPVGQSWEGVMGQQNSCKTLIGVHSTMHFIHPN